jgi:hypothetical protein
MKPSSPAANRKLIPGLAVACIILMILAAWLDQQITNLSADNASLKKSLADSDKRARDATAEAIRWHKQADSLLAQAGPAAATNPDGSAADASAGDHKRNFHPEEVAALASSKGMQSLIASQQAALIAMTYKDLLDRFKLSPQERDYMQKLLLDRQMVQVSNGMQMMNPSLSPEDRAALGQQIMQGVQADDAKIHDFLNSDSDYAAYQGYSQQEPERTEVGMFESSLGDANALDPATADSLAGLLADSRKSFPFTVDFANKANFANPAVLNAPTVNKYLDEQAQFQAQVADKAAALLTPAQLEAFKQNQAAMRQMSKMQLNNIVQMSGGGP